LETAEAGPAYLRFRVGKGVEADLLKEMIGFLVEKRMVRWVWAEHRPLVSFLSVSRPGLAPKSIHGVSSRLRHVANGAMIAFWFGEGLRRCAKRQTQ
jgi:hypothetical protein